MKTRDGKLEEQVWCLQGLYAEAISKIVVWLSMAARYAENERQKRVLVLLKDYYRAGDLRTFDKFSIEWL